MNVCKGGNNMAVIDARTHIPKKGDIYFPDCNILMYLTYTNGSYQLTLVSEYSNLFTKIIESHSKLIITDILLSEFVNTYIQTEFHRLAKLNHWSHDKRYFKSVFKKTQEYENILKEIRIIINRQLLPVSDFVDSPFSEFTSKIDEVFDRPKTFDFNDRYYGYEMEKRNAYIISNDADFADVPNCNIITTNNALLQLQSSVIGQSNTP